MDNPYFYFWLPDREIENIIHDRKRRLDVDAAFRVGEMSLDCGMNGMIEFIASLFESWAAQIRNDAPTESTTTP